MNRKIKFNILDFAIILLSILIVLSIVFWDEIRVNFIQESTTAELSFTAVGVSEETLSSIKKDDAVFISENENKIGKILEFSSEKEKLSVTLVDGNSKFYEADTYTVNGKMRVKCVKKENGLYIDDKYFVVSGKQFDISTSKVKMKIEITDVKY